jgi:hypothetical protein
MKNLVKLISKEGKYIFNIHFEEMLTPIALQLWPEKIEYSKKTVTEYGFVILCFHFQFKIVNKKEEEVLVHGFDLNKSKKEVTVR